MFLVMVLCSVLFSQEKKTPVDNTLVIKDSLVADTTLKAKTPSPNAIEQQITFNAAGYRKNDFINKKVYLVKDATVNYGEIILKADSIVMNMESGLVFATGRKDTTGTIIGSPVFKEGAEEFESKELTYNFKTKIGRMKNIVTKQEGGILHSSITKKMADESLNINKSKYTTCEASEPHFYVALKKAKVYPGKKIISGPAYLVLEDVPLPIILPFMYFPIQKSRASGLIIPRYGQEQQRGYYISGGGYYFPVNDYIDLTLLGDLYANGTWMLNARSSYLKLYKYSGSLSFSYAKNISGHKGLPDFSKGSNYRIDWTYRQDTKAIPNSSFNASVNMSSSGYDRNNSYNVSDHVTTQRQSSISYSKTWVGTPFNLSTSVNHSQNVRNKTVSLNLPKVNFNVGRIYPLKSKYSSGSSKWYQELQFQYSASVDNQINTTDSLLFTSAVWKNMKNGFRHEAPLSLMIRPFKKSSLNISPQIMYSGVMYTQKIQREWRPDNFNSDINKVVPAVITDTLRGVFYGQSVNPSISASISPQVFGLYQFTNPDSRLKAIRHVIRPTIGFNYIPVLKGLTTDMYKKVQTDTTGRIAEYSIFEGGIYGTPSQSGRSGSLTFGLTNIVEAKVLPKNDTTGKPKNTKIIENFGITTSYNIFADSLNWSPVNMSFRTILIDKINIATNGSFSLYAIDKQGRALRTFYLTQTNKLMRLTNFSTSVDFDLGQLIKGAKTGKSDQSSSSLVNTSDGFSNRGKSKEVPQNTSTGNLPLDEHGYLKFDVPWSLRLAYNFYYTKPIDKPVIAQTLSLSGDLSITKKMSINYTTGYDFASKQITMTRIGISRDLHCWEMNFDWIPSGYLKSWSFLIRVKASVLGDLKYERRKDFHDQY
jgi:lipopolysaccharide assembly outer membrane protein LptD (OstA)